MPDKFPDFRSTYEEGYANIDIDYLVKTYLTQFYNHHGSRVISGWQGGNKPSLEEYLHSEASVLKNHLRKLVLQQDLFWPLWCCVMSQDSLFDPETKQIWATEEKMEEAIKGMEVFHIPYAQTRLDMYFEHRLKLVPEEPTKLSFK